MAETDQTLKEAGCSEQTALTYPVSGTGEHSTQPPTILHDTFENQGNIFNMRRMHTQCDPGGSNTGDKNNEERNTCSVLHKEYITLVDYMNPVPILDLFMSDPEIDRPSSIRDIQEMTTTSEKNRKLVEYIRSRGPGAYTKFKVYLVQTQQENIAILLDAAERNVDTERIRNKIKETARELRSTESSLFIDLKSDIIDFYRENESTISVSPLVDEHDVKLEEFYIQPPMFASNKPSLFGEGVNTEHSSPYQVGNSDDKMAVKSYRELFINQDNNPYKHIYVTSPAGMGKTSFAQHLAMTWCQAHDPKPTLSSKFHEDDICTMQKFDVLFLLHLRDYQGIDICITEDLILNMMSMCLSRSTLYTKQYLQQLLHDKRCVVVLDGLDEWNHPSNCRRKPQTPHNNHPTKCTVVTTTRPWKLGTVGLSSNFIDRQVEIAQLDVETSRELISRAIKRLNEKRRPNLPPKHIDDFYTTLSTERLGNILCTPYIHLQQLCLWFDDCHIGNSKCECYSNIIDLILRRGVKRNENQQIPAIQQERRFCVPKCMKENELCILFFELLMKLGELAYFTLFREIKEATLIFDRNDVLKFLDSFELDICLKFGLLSQHKDKGLVSDIRLKVSFSHKSIQEFLCALYMSCAWNAEKIEPVLERSCSSLPDILEMADVFVFLSGMTPEIYAIVCRKLGKVVDTDPITQAFRTCLQDRNESRNILLSYQVMQINCFTESYNNGNTNCAIYLQDILLVGGQTEENLLTIKEVAKCNLVNLKSMCVWYLDEDWIRLFFEDLDTCMFQFLETLIVECDGNISFLDKILLNSTDTLQLLIIPRPKLEERVLTEITISAISNLSKLQDICLQEIGNITQSSTIQLFSFIGSCKMLRRVTLEDIKCENKVPLIFQGSNVLGYVHLDNIPVNYLDLSRMKLVKLLYLRRMSLKVVHLNAKCLEQCTIDLNGCDFSSQAISSLLAGLRGAPVLSKLEFSMLNTSNQYMASLQQLKHLKLTDIHDTKLCLSTEMKKLETLILENVSMVGSHWKELFRSVSNPPQPVIVELRNCVGLDDERVWEVIVDEIRTCSNLQFIGEIRLNHDLVCLTVKSVK